MDAAELADRGVSTSSSGRSAERYRRDVSTTRRRRRPALIVLVIVAAAAAWRWVGGSGQHFSRPSGTFQNLGYALQWPLFAWFCVYAYRKFVRYEEEPPRTAQARRRHRDTRRAAAGTAQARAAANRPDDPALREYNAYLAELAKTDTEKQNRTTA